MDQEEIKRSTDQILNDSLTRIDNLLSEAENLKLHNPLDRWVLHHCLLHEVPLLQQLLILLDYDGREQIIDRVRKIAENLVPVSNLECFK